tara:strand:+ start:1203 stop:1709 length:507 start_codon:yes stop_codon:yes gene_type:complete
MKKLIFTGPECSGKTKISKEIAEAFKFPYVEEYARKYLKRNNFNYSYEDLKKIAEGQIRNEKLKKIKKNDFLICDTNLQVIKLWSLIKYKKCDSFILRNQDYDSMYFLCKPDFEWEFDKLRENPLDRDKIFNIYLDDLKKNNMEFIILEGSHKKRLKYVTNHINEFIN